MRWIFLFHSCIFMYLCQFFHFHCIFENGLRAVSYTHLDVYKRQTQYTLRNRSEQGWKLRNNSRYCKNHCCQPQNTAVNNFCCGDNTDILAVGRCWQAVSYTHLRLDRETSGIVIFAKNQTAAARLQAQRCHNHLKKQYLAVVSGCLPIDPCAEKTVPPSSSALLSQGHTISLPIGPDPDDPRKMTVLLSDSFTSVSYTHLDVYKRQGRTGLIRRISISCRTKRKNLPVLLACFFQLIYKLICLSGKASDPIFWRKAWNSH